MDVDPAAETSGRVELVGVVTIGFVDGVTGLVVPGDPAIVVTDPGAVVGVVEAVELLVVAKMFTGVDETEETGPAFDAVSSTELAPISTMTEPFVAHETVTVTEGEADAEDGEAVQPVAEPKVWRSPAEIPETDSEKVNV